MICRAAHGCRPCARHVQQSTADGRPNHGRRSVRSETRCGARGNRPQRYQPSGLRAVGVFSSKGRGRNGARIAEIGSGTAKNSYRIAKNERGTGRNVPSAAENQCRTVRNRFRPGTAVFLRSMTRNHNRPASICAICAVRGATNTCTDAVVRVPTVHQGNNNMVGQPCFVYLRFR